MHGVMKTQDARKGIPCALVSMIRWLLCGKHRRSSDRLRRIKVLGRSRGKEKLKPCRRNRSGFEGEIRGEDGIGRGRAVWTVWTVSFSMRLVKIRGDEQETVSAIITDDTGVGVGVLDVGANTMNEEGITWSDELEIDMIS